MASYIETVALPTEKLYNKVNRRFIKKQTNSTGIYAIDELAQKEFILSVNQVNPVLAFWFGHWFELRESITKKAKKQIQEEFLVAINEVVELSVDDQQDLNSLLKDLFYEAPLSLTLEERITTFKELTIYSFEKNMLSGDVINASFDLMASTLTNNMEVNGNKLSAANTKKTENRSTPYKPKWSKEVWDITHPPIEENGLKGRYYLRWTAIEWPPLVHDPYMMYCHKRTENLAGTILFLTDSGYEDDEPTLSEIPGGVLQTSNDDDIVDENNKYVDKTWDNRINDYWVDEPGMSAIETGHSAFYHMFTIQEPDGFDDLYDWEELEKKINEQINDNNLEEKVEDELTQILEDIVDGLPEVATKLIGPASGVAAKGVVKLVKKAVEWLSDKLQGSKFETLYVHHQVAYISGQEPLSIVLYYMIEHGTDQPKKLSVDGLKNYSGGKLSTSIVWTGESEIPENKPLKSKGSTSTKLTLEDSEKKSIYWPSSYKKGGHIFVPINSKDDAIYAIAVRTEVRIADFEFQN